MTEKRLQLISNSFINKLSFIKNASIKCENMQDNRIKISILPDFLYAILSKDEITLIYADEHEEFMLQTYNDYSSWIDDAVVYIKLLASNTVVADYIYDANMSKLCYYISVINQNGTKKVLKKVYVSLNPFNVFKKKRTIRKVLYQPK